MKKTKKKTALLQPFISLTGHQQLPSSKGGCILHVLKNDKIVIIEKLLLTLLTDLMIHFTAKSNWPIVHIYYNFTCGKKTLILLLYTLRQSASTLMLWLIGA